MVVVLAENRQLYHPLLSVCVFNACFSNAKRNDKSNEMELILAFLQ